MSDSKDICIECNKRLTLVNQKKGKAPNGVFVLEVTQICTNEECILFQNRKTFSINLK